jgi:hypothetical protein
VKGCCFQKTFAKSVTCIVIDFISPLHALLAFQCIFFVYNPHCLVCIRPRSAAVGLLPPLLAYALAPPRIFRLLKPPAIPSSDILIAQPFSGSSFLKLRPPFPSCSALYLAYPFPSFVFISSPICSTILPFLLAFLPLPAFINGTSFLKAFAAFS